MALFSIFAESKSINLSVVFEFILNNILFLDKTLAFLDKHSGLLLNLRLLLLINLKLEILRLFEFIIFILLIIFNFSFAFFNSFFL